MYVFRRLQRFGNIYCRLTVGEFMDKSDRDLFASYMCTNAF